MTLISALVVAYAPETALRRPLKWSRLTGKEDLYSISTFASSAINALKAARETL
jgi:hypothetical protein